MILSLTGLMAVLAAAPAGATPDDVTQDRLRVLASDSLSNLMVDWCRANAPKRTAEIAAAQRKWQVASQVDDIRDAVGPDLVAAGQASAGQQRAAIEAKMASFKAPDTVCAQLPATWALASFNMQAEYPKAYPVAAAGASVPKTEVKTAPAAAPQAAKLAPGRALKPAQIETLVSSFSQEYVGLQFTIVESNYLVLKDGTVRKGMPSVGPSDYDVAADRAQNPKLWGQWQKSGNGYAFRFAGDRGFSVPKGAEVHGPARAGMTLNNRYETSSGYQIIGGAGSFSTNTLYLSGDGRFTRASYGFTGGSVGVGANTVVAGTTWDDKGSVTTVTGEGAAMRGGRVDNRGTPDAELRGTYRIDGYEMVLNFESGRRESHFVFVSANQKLLGIDDGTMIVRSK